MELLNAVEVVCLMLNAAEPPYKYFTYEVKTQTEIEEHYKIAFGKELKINEDNIKFILFTSRDTDNDPDSGYPDGYNGKPYSIALIKGGTILTIEAIKNPACPACQKMYLGQFVEPECKFDLETYRLDNKNILFKIILYDKSFGSGQYREWTVLFYRLEIKNYSLQSLFDFNDSSSGQAFGCYSDKTFFTIKDLDKDGNIELKIAREEYVHVPRLWPDKGECNTLKETEWLYRWDGEQFVKLKEESKESKDVHWKWNGQWFETPEINK